MRTASSYLNFRLWPLKGISIATLAIALAVIFGFLTAYLIIVFILWLVKCVITGPAWLWSRILCRWPHYKEQVLAKGLSFQCISLGATYSFGEVNVWLMAGYLTVVSVFWINQERKLRRGINLEHALYVMHLTFLMPVIPIIYHLIMPAHYRRIAAQCTAKTVQAFAKRWS
jgi:hypothetical protein